MSLTLVKKRSLSEEEAAESAKAESKRKSQKRYREQNPELFRLHQRRYRAKHINRDRAREYAQQYRIMLRARHHARQAAEVARRGGGCECCRYSEGPKWHFAWAHIVPLPTKQQRAAMKKEASDAMWAAEVCHTRFLCLFCHAKETEVQRALGWQSFAVTMDDFNVDDDPPSVDNRSPPPLTLTGKQLKLHERRSAEVARRGGGCEQCTCVGPEYLFQWAHMIAVKKAGREGANYALSANSSDAEWAAEVAKTRYLCLLCHADETVVQRDSGWAADFGDFDFFDLDANANTNAAPAP